MNTNTNKTQKIKRIVLAGALACLTTGAVLMQSTGSSAQDKAAMGRIPGNSVAQGGKGEQQGRVSNRTATNGSHLQLMLRVNADGETEVLKAAELPGEAPVSDVPTGNFAYEVLDGNEALAVEATVDPFEQRSFSGPDESDTHGHSIGRVESAIITIKVPKATLSNAKLDNLAVRFYRIKPEVDLQQINVAALQQLKQADQVEDVINIEVGKLAPQIRAKGRKISLQ